MAVTGFALVRLRNLFAVVMLSGIFSLVAAVLYVVMDAVDFHRYARTDNKSYARPAAR